MLRVLLLLVVVVAVVRSDWDIRTSLSTKSPYWSEGSTASTPPPEGCSAIHINLLARHGSRYPTSGDVKDLIKLASKIDKYSKYINNTYSYIRKWSNPYPLTQQGFLSLTGQDELFGLGQRFNATYYPLLAQNYTPDVYKMQSTQIPRTGVSASSFAQGYLQGEGNVGNYNFMPPYIFSDTPSMDTLRFFDNCPVYTEAMDNGTINTDEADNYKDTQYPPIAARITQMLGVGSVWNISVKDLDSMLTACAFEVTVFNKYDGWCAIFSPDDIGVFAYANDLEEYWEKSWGTEFGTKISSVLLQDIMTTIEGVIAKASGYEYQQAYLRFAHSEDIIPLTTLLGLFPNSYPLTANLSQTLIDNRNWTGSIVSPMGANLAFILYQCSDGGYRVKLTHNEVEYKFPGCDDLFCPLAQFQSIYKDALSFNFTQECALPVNATTTQDVATPGPKTVSVMVFGIGIIVAFVVGANLVLVFAVAYFRKNKAAQYGTLPT